ncbi:MAG: ABC transporter permease [Cyclobacteriaceae bacterium]
MKLYLLTFFRQSINRPKYLLINLFCLTLGIGCAFYIYLFVYKELNTDRFHSKHEDIYKVFSVRKDGSEIWSNSSMLMGPYFKDHLPEIKDYVRLIHWENQLNYKLGDHVFENIPITHVDTNFFSVFDFEVIAGSIDKFKNTPNGVFLLPETAVKLFGQENPIGKTISAEEAIRPEQKYEFIVVGLLSNYPEESTIKPQIIANIQQEAKKSSYKHWGAMSAELYLHAPGTNKFHITQKIKNLPSVKVGNQYYSYNLSFQEYEAAPLKNVYFFSAGIPGNTNHGDEQLINVLISIGFSILFLIVVNYIILNLGIITSRGQEIKTRRTLGASKISVCIQYLVNATLHIFIAFGIILILYPLIIQDLSTFEAYQYTLITATDMDLLLWFIVMLFFTSLSTGLLVYLVSTKTIPIINLSYSPKIKRGRIYQTLIQFQFIITIITIICVLFLDRQINLVRNADLGFDMQNTVLVYTLRDLPIREEVSKLSYVENIAHGHGPFSNAPRLDTVFLADGSKVVAQVIHGDDKFVDAYKIPIVEGSNLNPELCFRSMGEWKTWNNGNRGRSDEVIEVLVNKRFVEKAGLENPVGTLFKNGPGFRSAQIVGILDDYQNVPFYYNSTPIVLGNRFYGYQNRLGINVIPGSKSQLMEFLKTHFTNLGLGSQFDQLVWTYDFDEIYKREVGLLKLVQNLTFVIILISCLGLFALNLFISGSRTKEIGIRKVNGARVIEILKLINKDFVKWVVIAFIIATPIAWYAMDQWLQNFAYKTELSWWIFALAGLLALGIALLTVSWQSWKAATRNPVEALRYE